ncbi:hypothetical protein BDR03DRAFT_938459 [Suillus americanus]|nr:hypothetical protein BDR03DRAFT_938459 [Suillus americanus]
MQYALLINIIFPLYSSHVFFIFSPSSISCASLHEHKYILVPLSSFRLLHRL